MNDETGSTYHFSFLSFFSELEKRHTRNTPSLKTGGLRAGLCLIFSFLFLGLALPAFANPVLTNIAAGAASVQQTPDNTTINQSTNQAIINWHSFNVQANQAVHFIQPTGGIT